MDIQVKKVVVHKINKEENKLGASVVLSDNYLEISNTSVLISKLDHIFIKKSPKRAKFSDTGFQENIKDFSSFDLLQESKGLINRLKDQISNVQKAKGGYVMFCNYKTTNEFLAIFILRDTQGHIFRKQDNDFVLEETTHLDIRDLAMGAKINLTSMKENEREEKKKRYIQLTRGNTDISQYFEQWIGVEDTKQAAKDSDSLLNITRLIKLPENHKTIKDRDSLRKHIYEYANLHNSIIQLSSLSKSIYNEEDYIARYCQDKDIDIDYEFKLTNKNSFYKIKAQGDGIEISGERAKFSSSGHLIQIEEDKVIIRSQQLVDNIKQQMRDDE